MRHTTRSPTAEKPFLKTRPPRDGAYTCAPDAVVAFRRPGASSSVEPETSLPLRTILVRDSEQRASGRRICAGMAIWLCAWLVLLLHLSDAAAQSRREAGRGGTGIADVSADERIKTQAVDIIRGIIEGLSEGDYALFTSHFSDAMKEAQSRDTFLQLQKNLQKKLGSFRSMEYLGYYKQYGGTVTLFKARFSKEPEDVLIRLVLGRDATSPLVTGLWLDSPRLAN